jgi:pyruvate dehydrogenase E2 component (dihydrolipoamide acetyltransferase)
MKAIIMPQVGQDVPDAVISQWLKQENDRVEKGDVILVVESDKASFEIEAECSGVLRQLLYRQGDRVEVFKPLAYIGEIGEAPPPVSNEQPGAAAALVTVVESSGLAVEPRRSTPAASPSARRLAQELGINLTQIQGTGPGNRIIKRDVLAAASSASKAPKEPQAERLLRSASGLSLEAQAGPQGRRRLEESEALEKVIAFSRVRKVIADRLSLSKRTIPHFHLFVEVDMTDAIAWRSETKAEEGTRITITDLVVHAAAQTLLDFPRLNAHVQEDRLVLRKNINLGVAVAVEDGLLVPVIPNAGSLSLNEIAESSRKNAEAARHGVVDSRLTGTFTVSSLGMHGVSRFLPIINPPECAILGVGAAEPRVMPVPGGIGVRQMMTLDLACDHRAVDGSYAAGFLNRLKAFLEGYKNKKKSSNPEGGRL